MPNEQLKYLIILWRIGLRGSRGELDCIVRSSRVLAHERHPTGWVRRWRGASLLWTSGVLQRLGRIPRHATGTILLHWKTLEKMEGEEWGTLKTEGPRRNQRREKACKHEPSSPPPRPLNERIVSAPAALLGSLRVGTFSVSEQGERGTTLCW